MSTTTIDGGETAGPGGEFALGMMMGALNMFVASLGETLLRLSAMRAQRAAVAPPPWKRPMWFVGIVCILLGAPLDAASFVWAPMTSVIVLYALKQPVQAVMSRIILSETITRSCATGILLIALGGYVSLWSTGEPGDKDSFETPADFFLPQITVYLGISTMCLMALGMFAFCFPKKENNTGLSTQDLAMPVISAWLLAASKLFNAGWGRLPPGKSWYDLEWIWMSFAVVFMGAGVFVVNVAGLERMSPHIFMPIGFGCMAVITGVQGFLFGEFDGMPPERVQMWCLGLLGTIVGTGLVAFGSAKGDAEVEEQDQFLQDKAEHVDQIEMKL